MNWTVGAGVLPAPSRSGTTRWAAREATFATSFGGAFRGDNLIAHDRPDLTEWSKWQSETTSRSVACRYTVTVSSTAKRQRPTVAIVGMGHVGRSLADVNECGVAIVCTPTPRQANGSADVSSIEEVLGWLETDLIVIRSTVPPGT